MWIRYYIGTIYIQYCRIDQGAQPSVYTEYHCYYHMSSAKV